MESLSNTSIKACSSRVQSIKILATSLQQEVEHVIGKPSSHCYGRAISLAENYDNIRTWVSSNIPEILDLIPISGYKSGETYNTQYSLLPIFDRIIIGCSSIEGALNDLLKPELKVEVINALTSFKTELKDLEQKGLDLNIVKDINYALMEIEHAHYLSATIISSRVIQHVINNIPGKDDNEKLQFLVNKQIVSKERKDEQGQLMTAMRQSRNFLSHRVGLYPEASDALILLGGAFKLAPLCSDRINDG